jgi:hypothetical protein
MHTKTLAFACVFLLIIRSACHAADVDFEKIEFIGVGDAQGQNGVPHQSLKLIQQTGETGNPKDPQLKPLDYASVDGNRYRLFVRDVRPSTDSEDHLEKYKGDREKSDLYKFGYFTGVRTVLKSNKDQFIAQAFTKAEEVQPWVDGYNDAISEIQALR